MATIERLGPEALCALCDPARFTFKTTSELDDLVEVVGQARAMQAIEFGIGISRSGYNLFTLGTPGTGRRSVVRQFIERKAAVEPVPSDWCYVNNFEQPHKPRVLELPAGTGAKLRRDVEQLIENLRGAIPAAFESEEYRARRQELEQELKEQQERAFEELRQHAESHGISMIRTPSGMAFAPMRKGEVLGAEEFHKLPEAEQKHIEAVVTSLEEQLKHIIIQLPQVRREGQRRIRELERDVTMSAVGHLIDELKKEYAPLPKVVIYLEAVQQAVIDNADDFRRQEEGQEITILGISLSRAAAGASALRRFEVNVLIDHGDAKGAPVVYVDTSATWAIPRWGRIRVNAAGPLFNLAFAGALGLFAHLLAGVAQDVVVWLALANVALVVFNLSPLLEFDGYYVLADLTDTNALRRKAMRFVFRDLLDRPRRPASRREMGFMAYAVAALLYVLVMSALVLRNVPGLVGGLVPTTMGDGVRAGIGVALALGLTVMLVAPFVSEAIDARSRVEPGAA